jgi:CheY-like chemotaxis protein
MTPPSQNLGAKNGATLLKAVLVVDDDPNDFQLALREFKKLKLKNPVHHVTTVEEMVHYMKGEEDFNDRDKFPLPVLVMLDMHLATADGLDAAAWLRSQRKFRGIPIIAISGSKPNMLTSAVEMGAHALMNKPLNPTEFQRIIADLNVPLEFGTH